MKLSFVFVLLVTTAASIAQDVPPPPPAGSPAAANSDSIFFKAETEAEFPADFNWKKFLEKNLNSQVPVDNGAPAGIFRTIIQFIVDKTGTIGYFKAETNHGYGMEEEVIRVLKKTGKWKPASQDGRPVNSWHRQPVTFVIPEDGYEIDTKEMYTLHIGDNEISVSAYKVKPEDINISVSEGTVTKLENGKFIINLTQTGRVTITVTDTKKNKKIGDSIYDVKQ